MAVCLKFYLYCYTLWYKVSSFLDEDFNQRSVMIYGEIFFTELIPKGFVEKNRKGHFLNILFHLERIYCTLLFIEEKIVPRTDLTIFVHKFLCSSCICMAAGKNPPRTRQEKLSYLVFLSVFFLFLTF